MLFKNMGHGTHKYDKLQRWKKMYDPGSVGIIFRFPPKPLGLLMNSPCPLSYSEREIIDKIPNHLDARKLNKDQKNIIQTIHSTKTLRKLGGRKLCKNFNNCSLCGNWDWET